MRTQLVNNASDIQSTSWARIFFGYCGILSACDGYCRGLPNIGVDIVSGNQHITLSLVSEFFWNRRREFAPALAAPYNSHGYDASTRGFTRSGSLRRVSTGPVPDIQQCMPSMQDSSGRGSRWSPHVLQRRQLTPCKRCRRSCR